MGDNDGLLTNARATKNIPVFTDKSLIIAGKSVAEIEGAIFEFEEWSKRTGSFRTFFRHHAVILAPMARLPLIP